MFEKILESCNNCRDNYIGIQTITNNNIQLDQNKEAVVNNDNRNNNNNNINKTYNNNSNQISNVP